MANGKTIVDGISGIIKFLLFAVPVIIFIFILILFPGIIENAPLFWGLFVTITIGWWVVLGLIISSIFKNRRIRKEQLEDAKFKKEIELAREKGRAFRGED